jgi:hypothetical protein
MTRLASLRAGTVAGVAAVCAAALCAGAACAADDPKPPKPAADRVFIIGRDLNQLLEGDSDAVILRGEEMKQYLAGAAKRDDAGQANLAASQCRIQGELLDNRAQLTFEIVAHLTGEPNRLLRIGLAEANLRSITVDGRRPMVTHSPQGWGVWLEGAGEHTIAVEVWLPLGGSRDQPTLTCSIPETPVTTLALRAARAMSDVRLTPIAPTTVRAAGDAKPQIEAALGPRGKLDVRWRWNDSQSPVSAPLLRVESKVAANVEPGIVQLRTELLVQVLRGVQEEVELALRPDEVIRDITKLDGAAVEWSSRAESGEQRVKVRFDEQVSSGVELVVASQLPWSGETVVIRGLSVVGALSHRAMLALRGAPELDMGVMELEQARRVDPLALASSLRSPQNEAALVAHSQPFQVKLSVVPRRPTTTVRTTAVLSYDGQQAAVLERWQFAVHGGKVSTVRFHLPAGFKADDFLSSDSVQSVREEGAGDMRAAHVSLKGTPDSFEIRLRTVVPLVAARNLAKLELPWPTNSRSELSRLFLAGADDFTLDATPDLLRDDTPIDPAFAGEIDRPAQSVHAFRTRAMLDRVAFRLGRSFPNVWYQSRADVELNAGSAAVRQTLRFRGDIAGLRQVRLVAPAALRNAIRIESPPARIVQQATDGELIVQFDRDQTGDLSLMLSYRVPLNDAPAGDVRPLTMPLVRAPDAHCDTMEVHVAASANLVVQAPGEAWSSIDAPPTPPSAGGVVPRFAVRRIGEADSITLATSTAAGIESRSLVVERAMCDTTFGSTGEWRTQVRYFVSQTARSATFAVPAESRINHVAWAGRPVRARRDGGTLVVDFDDAGLARLPNLLDIRLEGTTPRKSGLIQSLACHAPRPIGDAAWGLVYWAVTLPADWALLHDPDGFSDENRVVWTGGQPAIVPAVSAAALSRWLDGSAAGTPPSRGYLFSRIVSLEPPSIRVVRRPALVLCSSGLVMVCGLVALRARRAAGLWVIGFAVAAGVVVQPLAAVEFARSGWLGVVLVLFVAVGQVMFGRLRTRRTTVFPEPSALAKSQGSSRRSSADYQLGAASPDSPREQPTTTRSPQLAPSSSVQ